MIIAWVGFASVGIIMARYFKPMWPGTQACKKPIWFTVSIEDSHDVELGYMCMQEDALTIS